MDSAYWVYIMHLPIVAFIPGLMAGLALPALLKFAITLVSTCIICFLTYHYFVRSTFIGMFLNGKVYKKK
jgi:glucan biosynthesis protein C